MPISYDNQNAQPECSALESFANAAAVGQRRCGWIRAGRWAAPLQLDNAAAVGQRRCGSAWKSWDGAATGSSRLRDTATAGSVRIQIANSTVES
jgi:hypothetical protein